MPPSMLRPEMGVCVFPSEVSAVLFSLDFVFSIRISLNVKITWASWLGITTGILL